MVNNCIIRIRSLHSKKFFHHSTKKSKSAVALFLMSVPYSCASYCVDVYDSENEKSSIKRWAHLGIDKVVLHIREISESDEMAATLLNVLHPLRNVLLSGLGKLGSDDATQMVEVENQQKRHVRPEVLDALEHMWTCLHVLQQFSAGTKRPEEAQTVSGADGWGEDTTMKLEFLNHFENDEPRTAMKPVSDFSKNSYGISWVQVEDADIVTETLISLIESSAPQSSASSQQIAV